VYAAGAVVHHAGSATLGHASDEAVFYGQRNLEWTWLKNTPTRLLWRSLFAHTAYNAAGALAYARQGRLGPWCRAKWAAMAGLPRIWRKRKEIQASASISPDALWQLMEPRWITIKRREKQFDFRKS
jgi:hypothetical protein